MSPPAVSQQIRALEQHLGTDLFIRGAQSVMLSDAGRAYLPAVQQAIQGLEAATSGLFGETPRSQVQLLSVLLFAQGVLIPALPQMRQELPGVNLMLTTANAQPEFRQGYADLRIIFGTPLAYGADGDRLMGEVLFPVARPDIAAQIQSADDLANHALIDVSSHRSGWALVLDALRAAPRGDMIYTDHTLNALSMAEAGLGVALARSPASDQGVRAAGLVRCLGDWQMPGQEAYHLIYPDRAALGKPARLVRDWLITHLKRDDM